MRLRHPLVQAQDALIPGAQIGRPKGVGQAQDGRRVIYLHKFIQRQRPGALGGRIGRDPLRVGGFDLAQLGQKLVELGVADQRIIQHMVAVVVEVDLLAQVRQAQIQVVVGAHLLSPV